MKNPIAVFSLLAALFLQLPALGATKVEMRTNLGTILLELDERKAPITVANFLRYMNEGTFNGTIFHRVIKNFMVQGGGFDAHLNQRREHEPIENEARNGLKNLKYTIAMARDSAPHTATSQFYINHRDNPHLDQPPGDGWGYCVFGKVIAGQEVVEAIAATPTGERGGMEDVPVTDVVVESVGLAP